MAAAARRATGVTRPTVFVGRCRRVDNEAAKCPIRRRARETASVTIVSVVRWSAGPLIVDRDNASARKHALIHAD